MSTLKRARQWVFYLGVMTMGLFEFLGAGAAKGAPALAEPEKYFDPQPSALVRAATAGDAARVRGLVAAGVNPNAQGPQSNSKNTPQITLLCYAIGVHSEVGLRLLIQNGADPLFEPREEDGDAFLFAVVRKDTAMLDALYRAWPVSKVPARTQSYNAFAALRFNCNACLQVMFNNGVPSGVQDSRGANLFMEAMSREDFETAEWLLKDVGIPLDAQTSRGLNSANWLQDDISRYRPGTPTMASLLRLKALMEARGVVFPVETAGQWRARNGVK